ncbi:interferon beta [Meriones unguiculatus]|uniref:interferon beta n=1 Tax=Meriones unguiculatus TaxID=10047 RepID=UPI000B4E9A2D|nr:interferon beta [Meriones unguiculatus]
MTDRWIHHVALLLCFSTTALSIDYRKLQLQQSNVTSTCQELLKQLDQNICLNDRLEFKIPVAVKHPQQMEKSYTAFTIQQMLQNIFLLFKTDFSSTGWNNTIIESLLGILSAQAESLETILKEKQEKEKLAWVTAPTTSRLKSYYWRVQKFLENKRYSRCAWMVVHAEISRNFYMIEKMTKNFQS